MAQKNLYLQNRNRLSDIENWLAVAKRVGREGLGVWISICKLLYIGWINTKVPLCIAQGTIFNILWQAIMEKKIKKKKKKVREEVREELLLQVPRKAVHVLLPRVEMRQRERKRNTNGNHEASRSWSRSVASLGCLRSQDIPGIWERRGWYWRAGLVFFSTQTNAQDPSRVHLVPTLQRASS